MFLQNYRVGVELDYLLNLVISRGWISFNPLLCSYLYNVSGIARSIAEMPVIDGLSKGITITSKTLTPEQIDLLNRRIRQDNLINKLIEASTVSRIYGTSFILALNEYKDIYLSVDTVEKGDELCLDVVPPYYLQEYNPTEDYLVYKGLYISNDNIFPIKNGRRDAIAIKSNANRFLGVSSFEGCLTSLLQFIRGQSSVSEMLSEAKVNVLRVSRVAEALQGSGMEQIIRSASDLSNNLNVKSTLIVDRDTEFEQRQLSFGGIDGTLEKSALFICAESGIPYSKLFGKKDDGSLNGGGGEIVQNYYALVESQVRQKIMPFLDFILPIYSKATLGIVDDSLDYVFPPIGTKTHQEETESNKMKLETLFNLQKIGAIDSNELIEKVNELGLFDSPLTQAQEVVQEQTVAEVIMDKLAGVDDNTDDGTEQEEVDF